MGPPVRIIFDSYLNPIPMKTLIIGASGLLARPVILQLEKAGMELRLFSRHVNPSMFVNEYEILQGDLFNPGDLEKAVEGCEAIHITAAVEDEFRSTELIVKTALQKGVRLLSYVSGATVCEENRWFGFTDNKFRAEQLLVNSGIPYLVFRPTWFFESLQLMVRNGKAMIPGHLPHPYHFLAADEFGSMVARAFTDPEKHNSLYYAFGPKGYLMKELLEKYCREFHPDIKKVSEIPIPVMKLIAFLTRNKQTRGAAELFSYFQKVKEPEISPEALSRLGTPEVDFENWVEMNR